MTLTALAFNLRAMRGPFVDARTRRALVAAIDRADLVTDLLGGAGARAETPIPPSSWAYDAKAAPEIAYDRGAASKGLRDAGWRRVDEAWIPPGASKPLAVTILAPEAAANVIAHAAATRVAAAWTSLGLATTVEALPPGELVERLRAADFSVAVIDVNMGLDPDPYPILASSQARGGGANVSGIQDAALDKALVAARRPGRHGGPDEGLRRPPEAPWGPSSPCPSSSSATASSWSAPTSPGRSRDPSPTRAVASGTWYDGPPSGGDPLRPVSLTPAEVAELVDALASGASVRKGVWVQIPSSVPSRRRREDAAPAQVAELVYAYV